MARGCGQASQISDSPLVLVGCLATVYRLQTTQTGVDGPSHGFSFRPPIEPDLRLLEGAVCEAMGDCTIPGTD